MIVISVDDLTYWAGPNSIFSSQIHAPNIQRLATEGISFTNAYTPEAICNPARTSFYTGLTPNLTGVHSNDQPWYETISPSTTLTAQFKDAGFDVGGFGKLLHNYNMPPDVLAAMFSEYIGKTGFDGAALIGPLPPGVSESQMADHITIDNALNFLWGHDGADPFMLNVGLVKPHLNWVVPQEYFDLYPLDEIEVPGLVGDDMSNVPAFIRDQLVDSLGHPVPGDLASAKEFLQGYFASISYADAQLGRLFDELDATGRWDTTTIILWSDHGYHLGDHDNFWGKFTLWEEATKVPFLFKLPDGAHGGRVVDDVVNLVDAYPTLLDLAGLDIPAGLSGDSLKPLLLETGPALGDGMSFTMMFGSVMLRTPTHAYIRYEDGSQELYNMIADPEQLNNLAQDVGQAVLLAQLQATVVDKAGIVLDQGGLATGTAGIDLFYLNDAGDQAIGVGGDDNYHINRTGVTVTEIADGGYDTVYTRVDFVLPDHVEDLVISRYSSPGIITVSGNDANNILTGSPGTDVLHGGAGNDRLRGGGSSDTLFGGTGNDAIIGYAWSDQIYGGTGNDTVYGGGGADTIHGDEGNDAILAGGTGLQIFGGTGNDAIALTSGSATVEGGGGGDRLTAAQGATLTASYASATIGLRVSLQQPDSNTGDATGDVFVNVIGLQGGSGNDTLEGNGSANVMIGGAGRDTLLAHDGNDTLGGGDGDDWLDGGAGSDVIDGGGGFDTVHYSGDVGQRIDLLAPRTNTGDGFGDSYLGIERLVGGFGNDTLLGYTISDVIEGGTGNDQIFGRAGNDTLAGGIGHDLIFGGLGADVIFGGSGQDTLDFGLSMAVVLDWQNPGLSTAEAAGDQLFGIEQINGSKFADWMAGDIGNERFDGAAGNDTLLGRDGIDILLGGQGDDWLYGGLGADRLSGGAGYDTVVYATSADILVDVIRRSRNTGEAVGDRISTVEALITGSGNDTLAGGNSSEALYGGLGQDFVIGRGGDDTLRGEAGNDTLSGGGGVDLFVFEAGQDVVLDWTIAQGDLIAIDRGVLGGQALTGAEVVDRYASIVGRDVVLDFGDGNVLTLDRILTLDGLAGQIYSF